MIKNIVARIKLYFDPPRPGTSYLCDSLDLLFRKPMEHVLHGLHSRTGDAVWEPVYGKDTCRMTIESDSMPYYRVNQWILAVNRNTQQKAWMARSQPRRIWKNEFKEMIIEGDIKYESRYSF